MKYESIHSNILLLSIYNPWLLLVHEDQQGLVYHIFKSEQCCFELQITHGHVVVFMAPYPLSPVLGFAP